jgi:hypothetical protein
MIRWPTFVAQVAQGRRKVLETVAGLGGEQEILTLAAGEWSPEILEHLFLAEQVEITERTLAAGVPPLATRPSSPADRRPPLGIRQKRARDRSSAWKRCVA